MTTVTLLVVAGIAALLLALPIGYIILTYNKLVAMRGDVDNGWAQIDVQLKQRHNLIPNLVETVKGYAAHEKDTLEAVISARQQAVQAPSDAAQAGTAIGAENILTQAVGKLFALAEAYPDLKADSSFMNLQEELSTIENKIAFARQHYNDSATKYNVYIVTFPPMLVANLLGFKGRDLFTVADAAVREAPKVSF